jgi:hyaluronoglucosaminidase
MNLYINAPKEDPYVRSLWRHPYPASEMAHFRQEIALANHSGIDWVPDIGPGLALSQVPKVAHPDSDICFSCTADRQLLVAKLREFVDAGAHAVMVSFDDDAEKSTHPHDAEVYGTGPEAYGTMNADLLDYVAHALPGVTVFTVPAEYSGTTSSPYLRAFASHLNKKVVVMWTGTQLLSPTIRGVDARAFDQIVGRKIVVWDNYPVNDYADGHDLFLGPVTGRGPDLVGAISGLVANPSIGWQTSKIALDTLSDDLNDPSTYNANASWKRAIAQVGGRSARWLGKLAENTRSSAISQTESTAFESLAEEFLVAYKGPSWSSAARNLAAELASEQETPTQLAAAHWNAEFRSEAAPFLTRLQLNAEAGQSALAVLEAERPHLSVRMTANSKGSTLKGTATPPDLAAVDVLQKRLAALTAQVSANHYNVDGVFALGVLSSTSQYNLMVSFLASVESLSTHWMSNAERAASSIGVTVNGRSVSKTFSITVAKNQSARVVARDGVGDLTELTARPGLPGNGDG